MPFPDITFAILAGGEGRRLGGVAKGLLMLDGAPVLARQLRLAPHVAEVLLVSPDPAPYARFGLRTLTSEVRGHGASGGLCAALGAARTPWVLALGCDMPFVEPPVLEVLAGARDATCDVVLFEVGGFLQPLLGLYRSALAASFTAQLPSHPSLRSLVRGVRARVLTEQHLSGVDARLLAVQGLNTPQDLARFGVEQPNSAASELP